MRVITTGVAAAAAALALVPGTASASHAHCKGYIDMYNIRVWDGASCRDARIVLEALYERGFSASGSQTVLVAKLGRAWRCHWRSTAVAPEVTCRNIGPTTPRSIGHNVGGALRARMSVDL